MHTFIKKPLSKKRSKLNAMVIFGWLSLQLLTFNTFLIFKINYLNSIKSTTTKILCIRKYRKIYNIWYELEKKTHFFISKCKYNFKNLMGHPIISNQSVKLLNLVWWTYNRLLVNCPIIFCSLTVLKRSLF